MKNWLLKMAAIGMILLPLHAFATADRSTPEGAQAMVRRAIEFYKANHLVKAVAEFSNAHGQFADRDLYVAVYSLEGRCLTSGAPQTIDTNMMDVRDGDGKYESERRYWEVFDGLVFATGPRKS